MLPDIIARLVICEAIRIIQKDVTDVGFRSVTIVIRGDPNAIRDKRRWPCSVLCIKAVGTERIAPIVSVPILYHKHLSQYRCVHEARIDRDERVCGKDVHCQGVEGALARGLHTGPADAAFPIPLQGSRRKPGPVPPTRRSFLGLNLKSAPGCSVSREPLLGG